MIKSLIDWFILKFHKHTPTMIGGFPIHASVREYTTCYTCRASCRICGKNLLGLYQQGSISKDWRWTYTEM